MRRAALLAAPTLWTDAVAEKVAEMAANDPDPRVRADAGDAQGRVGTKGESGN